MVWGVKIEALPTHSELANHSIAAESETLLSTKPKSLKTWKGLSGKVIKWRRRNRFGGDPFALLYLFEHEAIYKSKITFYTKENQVKWLKANVLPAVKTAYDDPEIKSMSNYKELVSWNEYASKGKVEFYPADYSELSVKLVQAAQNVVFNGADKKKELDNVANWYNEKNQK